MRIYLPKSATAADTVTHDEQGDEPRAQGETILVVEDDPDVRTLTVALLSDLGYTVLDAREPA